MPLAARKLAQLSSSELLLAHIHISSDQFPPLQAVSEDRFKERLISGKAFLKPPTKYNSLTLPKKTKSAASSANPDHDKDKKKEKDKDKEKPPPPPSHHSLYEDLIPAITSSPVQSNNATATAASRQRTILEDHGIMLGKVIGSGNYAKVKIGYSEEYGKRVAVKIISKVKAPAEYTQKFLPREIDAVKGLHHENLIAFYQSIETSHRVYLVMQLAENGTLLDYVREKKFLEETQARQLFKQLMSAIEYIHSKGVVHRDIKCENLLLDEHYNLKLIDFGFARKDTRTADQQVILSKTFCGSYAYASPEILKGVAYDPFLSDIWACGVVCYAMIFGRLPYDGSNVHILLKRINSALVFPKQPPTSSESKHMILHILAPLKIRYKIPQIKEDPWMLMR